MTKPNQDLRQAARGEVIADPLERARRDGAGLKFTAVAIKAALPVVSATLRNWDAFNGVLLCLCISHGRTCRIEGSAVMVAPGVALAALHVLEPHRDQILSGAAAVTAFAIAEHGLQIWPIRKITPVIASDLCILGLELASELPPSNHLRLAQITTRLPKVGEELLIAGFQAGAQEFEMTTPSFEAHGKVWVSKGATAERHLTGRDRVMVPGPALELLCPTQLGMSGGPAFDQHGNLVGLLGTGIEENEHGAAVSFVSLLWPALTERFEATWPPGIYSTPAASILERDSVLCTIDRREAITVEYGPDGSSHSKYTPWEA